MSRRPARASGLAASAAVIAVITLVARLTGFARVLVFAPAVGSGCTGTAYAAANQLPNVLFEVAAGGALAGAVVPVLAGALARGDRRTADRITSALACWSLLVLVPLALLLAAASGPLARLLVGAQHCPGAVGFTQRLLLVFAPQVALYGLGIVLTGALQARHRFAGPAAAPLVSSLVVIASYLGYAVLAGPARAEQTYLPGGWTSLLLSGGTTAGVAALSLPLLIPLRRTGSRLSVTLRLEPAVRRRVLALAGAGLGALLAQQISVVVTILVANRSGQTGVWNAVQYAQAVYLFPYAVLAVPIATAAFPRLSALAATGQHGPLAATAARSTRALLAVCAAGAAALLAAAPAVQRLFVSLDVVGGPALASLSAAVGWYAPGLLGWGLVALAGRTLYAVDAGRAAGWSTAAGWASAAAGCVLLAWLPQLVPGAEGRPRAGQVLLAVAASNTLGMAVAGAALLWSVRRRLGAVALAGTARSGLAVVLTAAVVSVPGQRLVASALSGPGTGVGAALTAVGVGGLAGGVCAAAVLAVGLAVDGQGLAGVLAGRLPARLTGRRSGPTTPGEDR